ncbi:DUF58 domain-containing protein [Pseudoxanthomonas broegbernensis]|uniref:DUF58 domain-containing protein n=1 Tax=Pseudoxanthomonas broegbernensis TaxID=83619 RepID=A0A7V8GP54_9GAMM|nr:DUF58 domain-containing protein [Pseudoxanthomonas broegbernensis]KAF1687508.1 DUF58 domain-containing protein [Pseudoxanthomonas broegbernensis]MBB6064513.1 uncharacterized protein (DUF58 family) [Pseudoxanthomonas broegbernensis]
MAAALRRFMDRLRALERPRAPEPLPVAIGRRRIYVLPTPFGLFYAALVLAMVLGALNYNNNPALLLALLLGAAGLASLIATHLQLSGLRVEAVSAEPVAAGQPLAMRLALSSRDGRRRRGLRADLDTASDRASSGSDGHCEFTLVLATHRRGWLEPGRIRLSTTQPLGLVRGWSRVWPRHLLLVYPRAETPAPPLPESGGSAGHSRLHPLGEEPHQLRAYRAGDPPRSIAWKHSARRDSLVVREFERSQGLDVVLDWRSLAPLAHERRIARLAAWVDQAEREGRRYRLRLPGQPELGPARGPDHRHACLRALAVLPQG